MATWKLYEADGDGNWQADLYGPNGVLHSIGGTSEKDVKAKVKYYNDYQKRHGFTVGTVPQTSITG